MNMADSGIAVTVFETPEKGYTERDYRKFKNDLVKACTLYYGQPEQFEPDPAMILVNDVWPNQQYDGVKAIVEQLESENPVWKERYERGDDVPEQAQSVENNPGDGL